MSKLDDVQQVGGAFVAALDLLHVRERDADHAALGIAALLHARGCATGATTIATHRAVLGETRHVALSIESADVRADQLWAVLVSLLPPEGTAAVLMDQRFVGPPHLRATLAAVLAEQQHRREGRVVVFPGSESLVGTISVGHIRTRSAIDDVCILAASPPEDAAAVFTRDFVRPRWRDGRLVLDTQPARGGVLVPFETPTPTPCCADHA